jgi:hypothetical protein
MRTNIRIPFYLAREFFENRIDSAAVQVLTRAFIIMIRIRKSDSYRRRGGSMRERIEGARTVTLAPVDPRRRA